MGTTSSRTRRAIQTHRITSGDAVRRAVSQTLETLERRNLFTAVVTTDLQDYAPGSTAYITASNDASEGKNFQTGETVQFRTLRINPFDGTEETLPGSTPWRVADGVWSKDGDTTFVPYTEDGIKVYPDLDKTVNGAFQTTWFVDPAYLDATLELTATGLSSNAFAKTIFTDGVVKAGMTSSGTTNDTAELTWTSFTESGQIGSTG